MNGQAVTLLTCIPEVPGSMSIGIPTILKLHYDTEHASSYDKFEGQFRKDKVSEL
jgi:hypothetical protein